MSLVVKKRGGRPFVFGSAKFAQGQRKVSAPVKKYVKKTINRSMETKVYDLHATAGTLDYDASPAVIQLTPIGQGDTLKTREGAVIKPQMLKLRLSFVNSTDIAHVRCIVIQWKKDTANETPVLITGGSANILDQTGGAGLEYNSPFDVDFSRYFNVLYDKQFVLEKNTLAPGSNKDIQITIPKKKMMNIYYNLDAGTNARNHLYLLAISDLNNAGGTAPTMYYASQVFFKD